ncbi:MAG: hypothetical protein LBT07_00365 [Endomicrobium sp.]|jgi:hypothetical protein|nr:hypothetical protein [Endomicrobium sp.]
MQGLIMGKLCYNLFPSSSSRLKILSYETETINIILEEIYTTPLQIIWENGHFYAADKCNNKFNAGNTYANCGLWAARRILRYLGQINKIDKDLWRKYSNKELRNIIVDNFAPGQTCLLDEYQMLESSHITYLLLYHYKIPNPYYCVYAKLEAPKLEKIIAMYEEYIKNPTGTSENASKGNYNGCYSGINYACVCNCSSEVEIVLDIFRRSNEKQQIIKTLKDRLNSLDKEPYELISS